MGADMHADTGTGPGDDQGGGDQGHEKNIEVEVFAPRSSHPKHFRWQEEMTVGEAAADAAAAFDYAPGQPTLAKDGVTLDRSETLKAAGVRNGDKLELVDIGGGV